MEGSNVLINDISKKCQKYTLVAEFEFASPGQYGHFNRPLDFAMLAKLSLDKTCPHGIIIGGFVSLDCSLDTMQENTE